ncbi:MAG: hypothetical protein ACI4S9_02145 [Christensenellales bacterium]
MRSKLSRISYGIVAFVIALVACFGISDYTASAESDATYIDFSTKMTSRKWTFGVVGSSAELANARTKGYIDNGTLVIPADGGKNWTMSSAVLRYNGQNARYNDIEYRFNIKFDGTVSGLGGQISLLATGNATKWGNNAEYGKGIYLQFWNGHTLVANYRNGSEGNSDGAEIGRLQMYNNEFVNSDIEMRVIFKTVGENTVVNVFANGNQFVCDYTAVGLSEKGEFGIVSGNDNAAIILSPYDNYGTSGLGGNATPTNTEEVTQVNLQEYIDAGYVTQTYNGNASNQSGVSDNRYVIDSTTENTTNVAQVRFGQHHYSTAALNVAYNFKLQIYDRTTATNDFTVSMYNADTGAAGYNLWFHSDGIVKLQKISGNFDNRTDLTGNVSLPANPFYGEVADVTFGRENTAEGVRIFVYFNGEKVIDYTATGDNVSNNPASLIFRTQYGSYKMAIAGYTTSAPYTKDGDPIDTVELLADYYQSTVPEGVTVPSDAVNKDECTILFVRLNDDCNLSEVVDGGIAIKVDGNWVYYSNKGNVSQDGKFGIAIFDASGIYDVCAYVRVGSDLITSNVISVTFG